MYCKYTLRHYLNSLNNYLKLINKIEGISFYRHTIITNNIKRRIDLINNYLGESSLNKKSNLTDVIRNTMKFMNQE